MTDPSVRQLLEQGIRHHQSGQFREAENLYRQVLALQPSQPDALHYLGVLAGQAGRHDVAIELIRRALAVRPQDREVQLNLANSLGLHALSLHNLGRSERAIPLLREALSIEPDNANTRLNLALALNNHGNALREKGDFDEAISLLREAQSLRPDIAQVCNNLGTALRDRGELDNAIAEYRRALALDPRYAQAWNNLGVALREKLDVEEAMDAHRRAIAIQGDYADAHFALGWALLLAGNFPEGWREYEWRLRRKHGSLLERTWDGSDLGGRRILLHAEQGFGDTIQFARYVSMVAERGGKVLLVCQRELVRLLKKLPGVHQIASNEQPLPEFDVRSPLMSLPLVFGTDATTIPTKVPYVVPDPDDIARWESRLASDRGTKVGLAWAGRATHPDDRNRSIALHQLLPLAQIAVAHFHSLQPIADTDASATGLLDHSTELNDFADTAGLIANLDLVITVDTAVAHLAGAMGKPVWLLLPFSPDWRWMLNRSDSPWYPTTRLFRQPKPGDWACVIDRVAHALSSL